MFYSGRIEDVAKRNPILAQIVAKCDQQRRDAPGLLRAFIAASKTVQAKGGKRPARSTEASRQRQLAGVAKSMHAAKRNAADSASNWGNCIHESAHAVVALVFGAGVDSVQVIGNGHNNGSAEIYTHKLTSDQVAIVALAGACAESKLNGQPIQLLGSDLAIVGKAMRGCSNGRDLTSVWKSAAKAMVADVAVWAAIKDVAREVSVRKMLDGERVKDIVSRHVVLN